MNKTLPVFAALAFGLAAVPAVAQDAPPPAEPEPAVEAPPPADAPEAAPADAPAPGPRGRRFGPRRGDGENGPGRPGGGGRPGFGRPGPGGFGRPDGDGAALGFVVPMLARPETAAQIGLDAEKAAALAATFADLDAKIQAANEKLPAAFKRQADALEAAQVDEAAVLAAVNEVWDLRREVAILQTRKLVAVKTTLDADQIAKARKLLKEAWKDFGDRGPREGAGPREGGDRPRRGPGDGPGRGFGGPRHAPAPDAQP